MHGVAAARTAGMHVVAVPNSLTRGMDFSVAHLVVDSLAELPLSSAAVSVGLSPPVSHPADRRHPRGQMR